MYGRNEIEVDKFITDGVKWRIQNRNSAWEAARAAATTVLIPDIGIIVAEYYLGTVRIIPDEVVNYLTPMLDVDHMNHYFRIYKRTNHLVTLYIDYAQACKNAHIVRSQICNYSDYLEVILTGYNEKFANAIFGMIRYANDGDFEKYTKCCKFGDARELTDVFIAKIRSEMLMPRT